MFKKILLPKSAFKCKGKEVVAGHTFTNGELVLSDADANKVFRKFVNFYGCTVEDVAPIEEVEDNNDSDSSLVASSTKQD